MKLNHNLCEVLYDLVKTFFTTGSASLVDCNFAEARIRQQNLDH